MSERKLFGTDRIRGRANVDPMTPELAMRLGRPIATDTRHVSRWALALLLGLVALVLLATRTRRSSSPHVAPVGPAPAVVRTAAAPPPTEPEPVAGDEPATAAPDRRTRQELYAEAQLLGIPGRSKMSKDELARAIADRTG